MKKYIASALLFALFIVACDKVKHPDQRPPVIPHCVDTLTMVVKTNTATSSFKKVLVEDYTGHTCQNCPRAAEAATAIASANGNKVVVLANHVSDFALPVNDTMYKEEFRNAASTAWDVFFNLSHGTGLPTGMVNRQTPYGQHYGAWAGLVASELAKPWSAKLDLTTYYDTVSKYINVKVKTTFKTAWPNPVNLVVLFTQDSIISDQKDGAPPPGATMDPNGASRRLFYHFDNLVLGAFDPWGDLIKSAPAVNDTLTKNYGCFLIKKYFFNKSPRPIVVNNDKYAYVVAFVYDVNTKEILQVEKLKIR